MAVKGSFSVHFTRAGALSVVLNTDITGVANYFKDVVEDGDYKPLSVKVENNGNFIEVTTRLDGTPVHKSDYEIGAAASYNIWIFIYGQAITVYCNDKWIYTYVMSYTKYVAYKAVCTLVSGTTLTDIRIEEIPDWRDAVYVDYEATGDNALQSIYQQRPVWMFPTPDRAISFTYHTTKDQVPAHHIWQYNDRQVNGSDISSDGLVYYYDVGVSTYALAAKEVGLVTRLYRLSELDIGGIEAARTIQEIALEHRNPVNSVMRIDPRLEISDRLIFSLVVSGTGTVITDDVIVEDISITIQDGAYNQRVSGRRNK